MSATGESQVDPDYNVPGPSRLMVGPVNGHGSRERTSLVLDQFESPMPSATQGNHNASDTRVDLGSPLRNAEPVGWPHGT